MTATPPPTATCSQFVPSTRMLSNAISAAAMPAPITASPRQSSGAGLETPPPRISLNDNKNPIMPSGMLTMKIHRQEATVATAPPRIGATTGAARAGQVSHAIAWTRSPFSLDRNTRRRPTGTIKAPPIPCTTRIATSIGSDTLAAHPTDARVNTAIAAMKTRRVPNRSAIHPLTGMRTATVTR